MIAEETAQAGLDAIWACLMELAEHGHDFFVTTQASPNEEAAARGLEIAIRLETLVKAATLLAQLSTPPDTPP